MMSSDEHKQLLQDADASFLQMLPGYPFLPCPICRGTEGCDHTVLERVRASGINWHGAWPSHHSGGAIDENEN